MDALSSACAGASSVVAEPASAPDRPVLFSRLQPDAAVDAHRGQEITSASDSPLGCRSPAQVRGIVGLHWAA